jgi:phytoene dehydrogenase-like protein
MNDPAIVDVAVIGAGLAGLTAAARCAAAEHSCTVIDPRRRVGGRARTDDRRGFLFNQGPHALYTSGAGTAVLRSLGVEPVGVTPRLAGGVAITAGRLEPFPFDPATIETSNTLPGPAKGDYGAFLGALADVEPAAHADQTTTQWLEQTLATNEARSVAAALVRLATYANDPDHMSAQVAISQLQTAFGGPLLYLHHGWQTLVDTVSGVATDNGATFTHTAATAVQQLDNGRLRVITQSGNIDSRTVIIAAGDAATTRALLPATQTHDPEQRPARVTCLDIGLTALPDPTRCFALGIDTPIYLSVHCPDALLAPEGHAVIHVARYLQPTEQPDADTQRAELETTLDLVQPGWRNLCTESRYLHQMTAATSIPTSESRGFTGRPLSAQTGIAGAYIAGDWVGPVGLLSDASLASASVAADGAIEHLAHQQ